NTVPDAIKAIRAARQDGRRAGIDYQGSYSNFEFQPGGFIGTGTMVWRVQSGTVQQNVSTFKEEQVAAFGAAPPKNCSAPSPSVGRRESEIERHGRAREPDVGLHRRRLPRPEHEDEPRRRDDAAGDVADDREGLEVPRLRERAAGRRIVSASLVVELVE